MMIVTNFCMDNNENTVNKTVECNEFCVYSLAYKIVCTCPYTM